MTSISMLQEHSIYCEQLKRDHPALYVKHVKQYQNEEQRKKLERDAEIQAYRAKVIEDIRNNKFEIMDEVIRNQCLAWKQVYLKNNNIYETLLEACETSEQRIAWMKLLFEKGGIERESEQFNCFITAIKEIKDIELIKLLLKYVSPDIKPYSWHNSPREAVLKDLEKELDKNLDKDYINAIQQLFKN
jgi:hypothetical protein